MTPVDGIEFLALETTTVNQHESRQMPAKLASHSLSDTHSLTAITDYLYKYRHIREADASFFGSLLQHCS